VPYELAKDKSENMHPLRHYALKMMTDDEHFDAFCTSAWDHKGSSMAAHKIPMTQLMQPISHRPLALQVAFETLELFSSSFHLVT